MRPTRSLQEFAFAIRKATPALVQELRHQPSPVKTAVYLGVSTSMVQRALVAGVGTALDGRHPTEGDGGGGGVLDGLVHGVLLKGEASHRLLGVVDSTTAYAAPKEP